MTEQVSTARTLRIPWWLAGLVVIALLAGGAWVGTTITRHQRELQDLRLQVAEVGYENRVGDLAPASAERGPTEDIAEIEDRLEAHGIRIDELEATAITDGLLDLREKYVRECINDFIDTIVAWSSNVNSRFTYRTC